jgi:DNA polymerase-4
MLRLGIREATATATNKLVSKVASKAIRSVGLIEVSPWNESAFLAHQNIALLPSIGSSLMRTVAVTSFKEIGEIAALVDGEAAVLFWKQEIVLRDNALGIDNSPVAGMGQKRIEKRADFSEDVIEEEVILGALAFPCDISTLDPQNHCNHSR